MGSDRSDLHRLVDELDEQLLNDALALLRTLKPATDVPRQPRRRLPMSGAYDSGRVRGSCAGEPFSAGSLGCGGVFVAPVLDEYGQHPTASFLWQGSGKGAVLPQFQRQCAAEVSTSATSSMQLSSTRSHRWSQCVVMPGRACCPNW